MAFLPFLSNFCLLGEAYHGRCRAGITCDGRGPFLGHAGIGLAGMNLGAAPRGAPDRAGRAPTPPRREPAASASASSRSAVRRQRRVAGVADRDQHIADEAVAAGALHRGLGEHRAERRVVELRKLGERRRARHVARGELGVAAGLRELVPRADREAVVAAVDAVADQRRATRAGSGPCARWSGTRCSAAHRAGTARETPRSGRRRGRPGRCRRNPRSGSSGGSSSVVKIAPRNSHEPNSRDTRLVCLPCQPSPAAAASGFSITAAVSTNTFTSPPACAISQRAMSFSRGLMTS